MFELWASWVLIAVLIGIWVFIFRRNRSHQERYFAANAEEVRRQTEVLERIARALEKGESEGQEAYRRAGLAGLAEMRDKPKA
jgi:cytochrome c-type biogenesis protein CcmH/NrfF